MGGLNNGEEERLGKNFVLLGHNLISGLLKKSSKEMMIGTLVFGKCARTSSPLQGKERND